MNYVLRFPTSDVHYGATIFQVIFRNMARSPTTMLFVLLLCMCMSSVGAQNCSYQWFMLDDNCNRGFALEIDTCYTVTVTVVTTKTYRDSSIKATNGAISVRVSFNVLVVTVLFYFFS